METVGTNIRCKHCGLTRDKHPGGVHWSDAHDFVEKCSLEGSPMSDTAAKPSRSLIEAWATHSCPDYSSDRRCDYAAGEHATMRVLANALLAANEEIARLQDSLHKSIAEQQKTFEESEQGQELIALRLAALRSASHRQETPVSFIDYQQRRGVAWDIIDQALESYNSWLLDDDYEAPRALEDIITKMRERKEAFTEHRQETEGEYVAKLELIAKLSGTCLADECDASICDWPEHQELRAALASLTARGKGGS